MPRDELHPSRLRLLWWMISDAWKYVLSLIGLATVACGGGIGHFDTPGHCGFWTERAEYGAEIWERYPDSCAWLFTSGTVIADDGDCPEENGPTCEIIFESDTRVTWAELPGDGSEDFDVFFAYGLNDDGTCPVSCEAEFGCKPNEMRPEVCQPCLPEEGCL